MARLRLASLYCLLAGLIASGAFAQRISDLPDFGDVAGDDAGDLNLSELPIYCPGCAVHRQFSRNRSITADEIGDFFIELVQASLTCAEVDGNPSVSPLDSVLFDSADGFTVTDAGSGDARIDIVSYLLESKALTNLLDDEVLVGTGPAAGEFTPLAVCDDATEKTKWDGTEFSCVPDVGGSSSGSTDVTCTNCVTLGPETDGDYVKDVADGTGIDGTATGEGSTYTPTLDLTEINSAVFGSGTFTTLGFNAGAVDPVFTFASGSFTLGFGASPLFTATLTEITFSDANGPLIVNDDPTMVPVFVPFNPEFEDGLGHSGTGPSLMKDALHIFEVRTTGAYVLGGRALQLSEADNVSTILFTPPGTLAADRNCQLVDDDRMIPPDCLPEAGDLDGANIFVLKAGDTMTGALEIEGTLEAEGTFTLNDGPAFPTGSVGFLASGLSSHYSCAVRDDARFIPNGCVEIMDDADVSDTLTASVAAANGANCSAGEYARGVDTAWAAEGCTPDDDTPDAGDYGNLTGGRSITQAGGTIDADQELYEHTKCINVDPGHDTTDWLFWRTERAITVIGIDCIVDAATSVVMTLRECNSNAASCGDTEAAITCAATNTTEASSVDDASIDAGDWMRVTRGTVTGSPTQVNLCMTYTVAD